MRIHLTTYLKGSNYSLSHIGLVFVTLLTTALLLFLGSWQMHRGHEKQGLIQAQNLSEQSDYVELALLINHPVDSVRYRKVKTTGRFINNATFLLDNQIYQGKIGYHVLTPFEIQNIPFADESSGLLPSRFSPQSCILCTLLRFEHLAPTRKPICCGYKQLVLVNRGWIAAPPSRQMLPIISRLDGVITIEGRIEKGYVNPLIHNAMETTTITWPLRIQKMDFELFSKLLDAPLASMTVLLESPADGVFTPLSLTGEWLTPERHFGYAFQWYSLAGLLWLLIFITVWRSKKP